MLDLEFKAPGLELGWFYPGLGDATETDHARYFLEDGSPLSAIMIPFTVPGHNIPHVWVYKSGQKLAIRDLIPLNKLLLLVGDQPGWTLLETEMDDIQKTTSFDAVNSWRELTHEWERLLEGYEAVLVRPDGIIAWRGSWQSSLPQL